MSGGNDGGGQGGGRYYLASLLYKSLVRRLVNIIANGTTLTDEDMQALLAIQKFNTLLNTRRFIYSSEIDSMVSWASYDEKEQIKSFIYSDSGKQVVKDSYSKDGNKDKGDEWSLDEILSTEDLLTLQKSLISK